MIAIRLVEPRERASLAPLLEELLRHYAMAVPPRDALEEALVAQPPAVEMLVAVRDGEPAAFASFAHIFPGLGAAPQLYMKELYVGAAHRGARIGEALMRELARIARARGCTRVDWTTSRDNAGARRFYERVRAKVVDEKVYFRLDDAALASLANDATDG